jgi:hypothetical protein
VRRLWLFALALTILLPLLAVMLALSAVSASQAQYAEGLAGIGIDGTAGDTWDRVKINAPGDPPGQPPNVYDEADAVYSAAHYRQASGAPR